MGDATYSVTVNGTSGGTVTGIPTTQVSEGTTITLTATPDDSTWTFIDWSATDGASAPQTVTLEYNGTPLTSTQMKTPVLTFDMPAHALEITPRFVKGLGVAVSGGAPLNVVVGGTAADVTASATGVIAAGTPVTLSAPTNVPGYLFDGWTFSSAAPTFTDGTIAEASTIKFNMPATNFIATANYSGGGSAVSNPVGEVAIAMKNGVVRWAMTNLSDNDTFATSESDGGKFWMWGGTVAVTYGATQSGYSSSTQEWSESSSDFSSTGTPCPDGWRLPTGEEAQNLINKTGMTAAGPGQSSPHVYTKPSVGTTFWSVSGAAGAYIIPLKGDTQKILFFPASGRSTNAWGLLGSESDYWASTSANTTGAWAPNFNASSSSGYYSIFPKATAACPVRCVR